MKVRLYPTPCQAELLAKTMGCKRWVWNHWLDERETYFHEHGNIDEFKYTTAKVLKETIPWLKEPDSISLQQARLDLEIAYARYFKKIGGRPRFKSKHGKNSYRTIQTNNNIQMDFKNRKLKLPKIGWIKFRDGDRQFAEGIKNVTVSRNKSGKYFASILIEKKIDIEKKTTIQEDKIAAFDMSCKEFMVGTGSRFGNPRFYRKSEQKLKKLHRRLSRRKKGSKNRDKARIDLARFYDDIGNQRRDWQQKLSTKLANQHDAIIIEDLNINGMKRFSKGIAKTVTLDFSWTEFTRMLDYKMAWRGKHLVKVGRFYPSSKLCSNCGFKHATLKLPEREWTCPECGIHHDRDENAAKNLDAEGKRILSEERNIKIITSTVGTTGSHASGDRVRPIVLRVTSPAREAVVDEGRIHCL